MWMVYAERKSNVPANHGRMVNVKLRAPRGKAEANAMRKSLTGFGWLASVGEEDV